MASRKTSEIMRLQEEISGEIAGDAPEIAEMVFGAPRDQPDVVSVSNARYDEYLRSLYLAENRAKLQEEARRDPDQYLKSADRIGVVLPHPAPGMESPVPKAGAFVKAAGAAPVSPPTPVLPIAPVAPIVAPPPIASSAPMILGPDGQPLPPQVM